MPDSLVEVSALTEEGQYCYRVNWCLEWGKERGVLVIVRTFAAPRYQAFRSYPGSYLLRMAHLTRRLVSFGC